MKNSRKTPLLSSVRDYFSKIRRFSRNAQLLLSASVLNGLAFGIWGVIFNLYLLGLGFQEDFIGLLFLVSGITYGLAAFPAGIICDRIGRRTSFLTGATVTAMFMHACRLIIGELTLTAGLTGLGASFIVPLFNVFFTRKHAATPEQIGLIFALGDVTIATGTLLAPVVSTRLGKVRAVAFTELISIPFIYGIAISPNLGFAAVSYLARGSLMNMAGPIRNNFAMEIVLESERATTSGLTIMADGIPRAISTGLARQIMREGNYDLPYFVTSILYLAASTLFLTFFRKTKKKQ